MVVRESDRGRRSIDFFLLGEGATASAFLGEAGGVSVSAGAAAPLACGAAESSAVRAGADRFAAST